MSDRFVGYFKSTGDLGAYTCERDKVESWYACRLHLQNIVEIGRLLD